MESSEHALESQDTHQSKDKNRKSKRAPQELYVPRGRRHNLPTTQSTASSQTDAKAVDKPEEDHPASRISVSGTKQQPRRNEKKKGREGTKGKQQRDRKTSTDGEGEEGKEAKEKAAQNKGKHGRKREQQRYVPRPLRDDAKSSKTSGEEGHLIKQSLDSVQSGDSPSSVEGRSHHASHHAEKKVPGESECSQKNASPVPEDWDEIDCDDKDLICHPTGTRLTAHGKLIPVDPDDVASLQSSTSEMQARVKELEAGESRLSSVSQPNESSLEAKGRSDAKPNEGSTLTDQDVIQADKDNATTHSNKFDAPVQDVNITGERPNATNDPSAWNDSNIQIDGSEAGDISTSGSLCATPEQNTSIDKPSADSQETLEAEKAVTQGTCTDLDPHTEASVSPNAGDADSRSLQPEPPTGKSSPPSSNDISDATANNPQGNTLNKEDSAVNTAPSTGDTDTCNKTHSSPKEELDVSCRDEQTEIEIGKGEESAVAELVPSISELDDAKGDNDGKDGTDEADDDDWDAMFDESGDCLKQEEMEELSEGVGNVQVSIKHSKKDYYNYQPKDNTDYSEFEHVIEVFDFPADFKTQDLIMGFSNMKTKEMDIKWIDDTHALAIFPSAIVAQDALSMSNPMFRTRPLLLASREAKMKARHCQEFLLPSTSKPRPETSAATARRLVSGALGLKSNVSKEQRAAERSKIREAKDRRRMEKKQQEDIWDGNI